MNKFKKTKWTSQELEFLHRYYPRMGKMWCAENLGRSEASIRQKTFELKLTLDKESEFWKEFQKRAAKSKMGKKRPDQALVMQSLHKEGKLKKTEKQRKEMSLRTKKWISENGHPKGMLGKHHTQEVKDAIGAAHTIIASNMSENQKYEKVKKMIMTKTANGNLVNNRQKTTWKGGWREIGGKRKFFRSRWEANYARFLEWLKLQGKIVDWQHESKTFWFEGIKRGCVSYLPDFCIQELDGTESFHEVKGWMDDRSKTKIKRMAKYYPKITLIVIASKEYKMLADQFSAMIEGWEA